MYKKNKSYKTNKVYFIILLFFVNCKNQNNNINKVKYFDKENILVEYKLKNVTNQLDTFNERIHSSDTTNKIYKDFVVVFKSNNNDSIFMCNFENQYCEKHFLDKEGHRFSINIIKVKTDTNKYTNVRMNKPDTFSMNLSNNKNNAFYFLSKKFKTYISIPLSNKYYYYEISLNNNGDWSCKKNRYKFRIEE